MKGVLVLEYSCGGTTSLEISECEEDMSPIWRIYWSLMIVFVC